MNADDPAITYANILALTDTSNHSLTPDEQMTQFFYRHTKEEFAKLEENIDRKKVDYKDTWTEIYQLIGFFSVFQGVWFQGIAQLAAQRTCRFYIIPIVLSVLVSGATLQGVSAKFIKVRLLQEGIHTDKLLSKVLNTRISAFKRHGLRFNLKASDKSSENCVAALRAIYDEELVDAYLRASAPGPGGASLAGPGQKSAPHRRPADGRLCSGAQ